jgi:predicted ATPase
MYKYPVEKISIDGYKSIKHLEEFGLNKLNVLIGANGAGKSNFISLFKLLNEIVEGRLQNYIVKTGGANKILYNGSKVTDHITITIDFGRNEYLCKLSLSENDSLYIEKEECYFQGPGYNRPYSYLVSNDEKESGLPEESKKSGVVATTLNSIKSWRIYHFHDTSDTAPMKRASSLEDNQLLRPDASNIAAYLYLLEQKYKIEFQNISDVVASVAPFFGGFILHPSEVNAGNITLEWKHKTSDEYFDATALSDGTLRFICLATLLLQPKEKLPSTIMLDEPELGLHPQAITVLTSMLQSASRLTQVIVSTQSVTLINQLLPDNIVVVDRDKDQSVFRRLNATEMESWVDDYGLGDLWEKNVLGGRP